MNNGQFNMNMLEGMALPVSPVSLAPAAATTSSTPLAGADFAELLQGIQLMTLDKDVLVSWQEDPAFIDVIKKQITTIESGTVSPAVDLLVPPQASPLVISASEPAVPKQKSNEDDHVENELLDNTRFDVTSQLVLAAYSQSGRMPEVNTLTPLNVDTPQNLVTEQLPFNTAPAQEGYTGLVVAAPELKTPPQQTATLNKQSIFSTGTEQNQHRQTETIIITTVENKPAATLTSAGQAVPSFKTSGLSRQSEPSVDRQQNVTTATVQSAVNVHEEQTTVPPAQSSTNKSDAASGNVPAAATGVNQDQLRKTVCANGVDKQPAAAVTAAPIVVQPVLSDRTSEIDKTSPAPVERLQKAVTAIAQPHVMSIPATRIDTEQPPALPEQTSALKTPVDLSKEPVATHFSGQKEQNRTVRITASEIVKTTVDSIARLQKLTTAMAQPVESDTITMVKTAGDPVQVMAHGKETVVEKQSVTPNAIPYKQSEPARIVPGDRSPLADMATTVTPVSVSDESIVTQGLKTSSEPATPAKMHVAEQIPPQTDRLPLRNSTLYTHILSPESTLDIQTSQTRPITVPVTTAAVATDTHTAAPVSQLLFFEQHIDKAQTGNEKSYVKEMTQALSITAPTEEAMGSHDSSGNGEMNQGQPDAAPDNLMLTQNVRGESGSESKSVIPVSPKTFPAEPVRHEVPEQVFQQVKERLVQHDVKPGNQQITLTLSPENLGELKMNLNLQGQKLSVEIVTENRAVRDAIVLHTDALKESLARQNITMESFDVTTGGKGSGNQGQNNNAWRELAKQQQQQQPWMPPRGYNTAQADLPSSQAANRKHGQSMLDIHY